MDSRYSAMIMKAEQLSSLLKYNLEKIYIPFDLFFWGLLNVDDIDRIHKKKISVYIVMPRIIRKRDNDYLETFKNFLMQGKADGVLIRNIDSVGYIESIRDDLYSQYISVNGEVSDYTSLMIESDYSLYNWNKQSHGFIKAYTASQTVPMELSIHEIRELEDSNLVFPIYGRASLMVSANCVKKTTGNCMADCTHGSFEWTLQDRKNKHFPVYSNCIHCYNEIFNSVPTSLHRQMVDIMKSGFSSFRLDFTDESNDMIEKILSYYIVDNRKGAFPISEYTTAHFNKGAI